MEGYTLSVECSFSPQLRVQIWRQTRYNGVAARHYQVCLLPQANLDQGHPDYNDGLPEFDPSVGLEAMQWANDEIVSLAWAAYEAAYDNWMGLTMQYAAARLDELSDE